MHGKPELSLTGVAAALYERVKEPISPSDEMFQGNLEHYFADGASAINVIVEAVSLAELPAVNSLLDFGSGGGRVTRWLAAAYPGAAIVATDIREELLEFCRGTFGVSTWPSVTSVADLASERDYDLIWAGSVITHLCERNSRDLLAVLMSWLTPGGLLVLSSHGRFARWHGARIGGYGTRDRWTEIEHGYEVAGYGYADYPMQEGYGISVIRPSWFARWIEAMPQFRLVMYSERAWDRHHDVVAIQNCSVEEG